MQGDAMTFDQQVAERIAQTDAMRPLFLAMNAEIASILPAAPAGVATPKEGEGDTEYQEFLAKWADHCAAVSAVWSSGAVDEIRMKHGFVRCADATGWRRDQT